MGDENQLQTINSKTLPKNILEKINNDSIVAKTVYADFYKEFRKIELKEQRPLNNKDKIDAIKETFEKEENKRKFTPNQIKEFMDKYSVVEAFTTKSRVQVALFEHKHTGEKTFGIAGTDFRNEPWNDLVKTDGGIFLKGGSTDAVTEVADVFQKWVDEGHINSKEGVRVTGHSSGQTIGQYMGWFFPSMVKGGSFFHGTKADPGDYYIPKNMPQIPFIHVETKQGVDVINKYGGVFGDSELHAQLIVEFDLEDDHLYTHGHVFTDKAIKKELVAREKGFVSLEHENLTSKLAQIRNLRLEKQNYLNLLKDRKAHKININEVQKQLNRFITKEKELKQNIAKLIHTTETNQRKVDALFKVQQNKGLNREIFIKAFKENIDKAKSSIHNVKNMQVRGVAIKEMDIFQKMEDRLDFAEKMFQKIKERNQKFGPFKKDTADHEAHKIKEKSLNSIARAKSFFKSHYNNLSSDLSKKVRIWNQKRQDYDSYKVTDAYRLSKLATSFGLGDKNDSQEMLVKKLFNLAGNGSWKDREITNSDGSTQYLYQTNDGGVAITPVDNDFYYAQPISQSKTNSMSHNKGFYLPPISSFGDVKLHESIVRASYNFEGNGRNHRSPLTFDLDGDGVETTHIYDTKVYFDIDNDNFAERVGWIAPDDGQLAFDKNENGVIDNITELFGDDIMPAFDKLAKHDSNKDGKIDKNDKTYNKLLVWRDLNQNGVSEKDELKTLTETGIQDISLSETKQDTWQKENYISGKANFTWNNGKTGEISDVHFLNDNLNTWFKGAHSQVFGQNVAIDYEAVSLLLSRGYGSLPSMHIAMSKNIKLKNLVEKAALLKAKDLDQITGQVENILYEWAGVTDNDPQSRKTDIGNNVDGRKVDFLEKFTDILWDQNGINAAGIGGSIAIKKAWHEIVETITIRLLIQQNFKDIFKEAVYIFQQDEMQLKIPVDLIMKRAKAYIADHQEQAHEFWLKMANILITHRQELNISVSQINNLVSSAFGKELYIGTKIVTSKDGQEIYSRSDGQAETLFLSTRIGNNQANRINGSNTSDVIFSEGGADHIKTGDGDDYINAGSGKNTVSGGKGNDFILSGSGDDVLSGDEGRDALISGPGKDQLNGGDGDDYLQGGEDADQLDGGQGVDTIAYVTSKEAVTINLQEGTAEKGDAEGDRYTNIENVTGSQFDDTIIGDDQPNSLTGERGDDHLYGGKGNDSLYGGEGDDKLFGGKGDDVFLASAGEELYDGGEGNDTVYYNDARIKKGVHVDLAKGKGFGYEGDHFVDVENVVGTFHDDVIEGDDKNNLLSGSLGNNTLSGRGGDDIFYTGLGNSIDQLYGGLGKDRFILFSGQGSLSYIHDFDVNNNEQIDLTNFTLDKLELTYKQGETIVNLPQQKVILKNIKPSDLTLDHFILSKDSSVKELEITNDSDQSTDPLYINLSRLESHNSFLNETDLKHLQNITGTTKGDVLIGNDLPNEISGNGGQDVLKGLKGNDLFNMEEGSSFIDGGGGFDKISYTALVSPVFINLRRGVSFSKEQRKDKFTNIEHVEATGKDDVLIGDDQDNILNGNQGHDIIFGDKGKDILISGGGMDHLFGQENQDRFLITKYKGSKTYIHDFDLELTETIDLSECDVTSLHLQQQDKHTVLHLESQTVFLLNIDAKDMTVDHFHFNSKSVEPTITILEKRSSKKNVQKGTRFDNLFEGQFESDVIDGQEGIDTVTYHHSFAAVDVNLSTHESTGGTAEGDELTNIENIIGSQFDDVLTGSDQPNILKGNAGDDILNGKGNNNILSGGRGNDIFIIEPSPNNTTTIDDFESENKKEKINLEAFNLSKLTIHRTGDRQQDAEISLGQGQKIRLLNVGSEGLGVDNFIFKKGSKPLLETIIQGTEKKDEFHGSEADETFYGNGGGDIFYINKGKNDVHVKKDETSKIYFRKNPNSITTIHGYFSSGIKDYLTSTFEMSEKTCVKKTSYTNAVLSFLDFPKITEITDTKISVVSGSTVLDLGEGQKIILKGFQTKMLPLKIALSSKGGYHIQAEIQGFYSKGFEFYNSVLEGTEKSETLEGGATVDRISGKEGDDHLLGYGDDDVLNGNQGKDKLNGGDGNDTLTGGSDADQFIIEQHKNTVDVITDFEFWRSEEKVDLSAFDKQFSNFNDLSKQMKQEGKDTTIELGVNQKLIIKNIQLDRLSHKNFIGKVSKKMAFKPDGYKKDYLCCK